MTTTVERDGSGWRLRGEKTWISNGGIADFYVVFARMPHLGPKAFGAFVVDAAAEGLEVAERLTVMAPHPLARLKFHDVRLDAASMVGEVGKGLRVALGTLDVFRTTVGAAALGMARRALDEAKRHVAARQMFGGVLADLQLTQARIATMATDVDASALLIYRAAWTRDVRRTRVTREAAMAKWYATEAAQRVIDGALQLFGGMGVLAHHPVERLYREIRALRVYEGASEVQQLVIAGQVLQDLPPEVL
jgi:acyl-CoA dehydrogenase